MTPPPIPDYFRIGFINCRKFYFFNHDIHTITPMDRNFLIHMKDHIKKGDIHPIGEARLLLSYGSGGGPRTPDLTGMNRTL